jgi:hypothetical protein
MTKLFGHHDQVSGRAVFVALVPRWREHLWEKYCRKARRSSEEGRGANQRSTLVSEHFHRMGGPSPQGHKRDETHVGRN